jgi:hypothetical protein
MEEIFLEANVRRTGQEIVRLLRKAKAQFHKSQPQETVLVHMNLVCKFEKKI